MQVSSAPTELTPATKAPSADIVIDSHGSLVAETKVDGASAANIRVGDPVQLAVPQHPAVDGKVSSIGIISTDESGAESAPVTVMIDGKPAGIYPGLSAEVTITLVQKKDVLSVPSDAVHTSGTRTFVEELVNGRSVDHTVRVELSEPRTRRSCRGSPTEPRLWCPGDRWAHRSGNRSRGFDPTAARDPSPERPVHDMAPQEDSSGKAPTDVYG